MKSIVVKSWGHKMYETTPLPFVEIDWAMSEFSRGSARYAYRKALFDQRAARIDAQNAMGTWKAGETRRHSTRDRVDRVGPHGASGVFIGTLVFGMVWT